MGENKWYNYVHVYNGKYNSNKWSEKKAWKNNRQIITLFKDRYAFELWDTDAPIFLALIQAENSETQGESKRQDSKDIRWEN